MAMLSNKLMAKSSNSQSVFWIIYSKSNLQISKMPKVIPCYHKTNLRKKDLRQSKKKDSITLEYNWLLLLELGLVQWLWWKFNLLILLHQFIIIVMPMESWKCYRIRSSSRILKELTSCLIQIYLINEKPIKKVKWIGSMKKGLAPIR